MLVMASNVVGCVVQPTIGHLADRKNQTWVMMLGLLMAGGGIAMTGIMPNFWGLIAAVIISGIGIAMFHPQAARLLNRASEGNPEELGSAKTAPQEKKEETAAHYNNWSGFIRLCIIMIGWSMISHGMSTFLSLHLMNDLGVSQGLSSSLLSVYFGVAACCTLLGGKLAEQFG